MNRPHLIDWAITNKCNLQCLHCRGLADAELDGMALLRVAEEIPALEPGWVILEGGEALMREELFEVIETLRRNQVKVYLISNGMLLDEATALRLADLDVNLMISIDGADRESYEKIRKGASFHQLQRSVALAAEAGILDSCPVTIGKHNLGQVGDIFRFAGELGYRKLSILGLKPCSDYQEYTLNGADFESLFREVVRSQRDTGLEVYVDEPFFRPFLEEHTIDFSSTGADGIQVPEVSRCVFGEYMFIEANGDVKPCTFAPLSMGNLRAKSLGEVWSDMRDSDLIKEVTDLGNRHGPCGACVHLLDCGGCRSRAFALTGIWTASDPSCPLKGARP